ncbi:MAG: sugar phosphate isomerase/epimerase family protein [Acidobacteriaceae bacterium]
MAPVNISRRKFLATAGCVTAGSLLRRAGAEAKPMRLGGPIFVKSDDPAVLAKAHRDLGYRAAYAPADLSVTDKDRIATTVKEFARQDVAIAEVGAWKNMLDPDPEKRRSNVAYVTERLALAEALGARNCVDIAGSYDAKVWYGENPKNLSQEFFDATVENCRRLIDAVKPQRTFFSIEMMPWSIPSTPEEYVRLVKAVDRKAFGVHMDVCNTMNSPVRFYNNSEVIRDCFRKLGPWIKSCHAKDLQWGPGVQVYIQEVVPGTGLIDYKTYLQELSRLGTDAPLMLEHLHSEAEYTQGREYIQGVARSLGLSFAPS